MSKNPNSIRPKILGKVDTEWYLKAFLLSLLVVFIISAIILSSVPPVSKDALVHHLAVPKLYLKAWWNV